MILRFYGDQIMKANPGLDSRLLAKALVNLLDIAETVAEASLLRRESRGAHQRLDYPERDDAEFLRHSLAFRQADGRPRIEWLDVTITRSQPGVRDYSGGKS